MKQGNFAWFSSVPEPLDAPYSVLKTCNCEADAVTVSLAIAFQRFGRTRSQVAKLCGWKSASFLSEIAEENNPKTMPEKRIRAFLYATGCNLVAQWHERQREDRKAAGAPTKHELAAMQVAACLAQWEARAA